MNTATVHFYNTTTGEHTDLLVPSDATNLYFIVSFDAQTGLASFRETVEADYLNLATKAQSLGTPMTGDDLFSDQTSAQEFPLGELMTTKDSGPADAAGKRKKKSEK